MKKERRWRKRTVFLREKKDILLVLFDKMDGMVGEGSRRRRRGEKVKDLAMIRQSDLDLLDSLNPSISLYWSVFLTLETLPRTNKSLIPSNYIPILFTIMIPLSMQHQSFTRWKQTVAIYQPPFVSLPHLLTLMSHVPFNTQMKMGVLKRKL